MLDASPYLLVPGFSPDASHIRNATAIASSYPCLARVRFLELGMIVVQRVLVRHDLEQLLDDNSLLAATCIHAGVQLLPPPPKCVCRHQAVDAVPPVGPNVL